MNEGGGIRRRARLLGSDRTGCIDDVGIEYLRDLVFHPVGGGCSQNGDSPRGICLHQEVAKYFSITGAHGGTVPDLQAPVSLLVFRIYINREFHHS